MKKSLFGKMYHSAKDINSDLENLFASRHADFYENGIKQLPERWKKCVTLKVTDFNISDPRTNDFLHIFINFICCIYNFLSDKTLVPILQFKLSFSIFEMITQKRKRKNI